MNNWDETTNPVEDLIELRKRMLDPNTTKEYFEKVKQHKIFVYKQITIMYFRYNPNSTLEQCLKDFGMKEYMNDYELFLEVFKELVNSGKLSIVVD